VSLFVFALRVPTVKLDKEAISVREVCARVRI